MTTSTVNTKIKRHCYLCFFSNKTEGLLIILKLEHQHVQCTMDNIESRDSSYQKSSPSLLWASHYYPLLVWMNTSYKDINLYFGLFFFIKVILCMSNEHRTSACIYIYIWRLILDINHYSCMSWGYHLLIFSLDSFYSRGRWWWAPQIPSFFCLSNKKYLY